MALSDEEKFARDALVFNNMGEVAPPDNVTPFRGRIPMPEAPNPAIPTEVWQRLQAAGDLASKRMLEMLQGEGFLKMRSQDKLALIQMALANAYPAGAQVNKHLHVNLRGGDDNQLLGNSLTQLSHHARKRLPEFSGSRQADVTIDGSANVDTADEIIDND